MLASPRAGSPRRRASTTVSSTTTSARTRTCSCARSNVHRRVDRAAARAVRRRCVLRGEVAHGDALPGERGRHLREDLARAPGARLEQRGTARAPGPRERRVARRPHGGLAEPHRELRVEMPLEALVSLVIAFNLGIDGPGASAASRPAMRSSSTGSTGGCRADQRGARPSRHAPAIPTRAATSSATASRSLQVYGSGEPTVLSMPTWSIIHSRHWKMQIPYLAPLPRARLRRTRQRPLRPPGGAGRLPRGGVRRRRAGGVLGHRRRAGRGRVALSRRRAVAPARSGHPDRVEKLVFIAPALPLPPVVSRSRASCGLCGAARGLRRLGEVEPQLLARALRGLPRVLFSQCFSEPHSTKPHEDAVGWGLDTDAETLVATRLASRLQDEEGVRALLDRVGCPVLVIHGRDDAVRPYESGARRCGARRRRARDARGLGPPAAHPATRSR